jgi:membrane-bound ClpP family serine protease
MVIELFFVSWGFIGLMTNEVLIEHGHSGAFGAIALSAPIALVGGMVVARLGAALMNRVLPREETSVTSRDSLFGLTGEVTFEVTASGGRIHVYDGFGTLHDEACRAAAGDAPIKKGATAMVEDIDTKGNLIVREVAR